MTDLTTARGVLAELVGAHEKLAQLVAATTVGTEANNEFAAVTKRLDTAWAAARALVAKPQPDERELFEIWVRKHYVDFAAFIEFEVWKERATR